MLQATRISAACRDISFTTPPFYAAGPAPAAVASANINGDDSPDLVVVNKTLQGTGGLAVLLGNSDGSFSAPTIVNPEIGGSRLAIGDFNGDGLDDVAVSDQLNRTIDVFINHGGTLQLENRYSLPILGSPDALVSGDFDGDGKQDLAVVIPEAGLVVLRGNGDGSFMPKSIDGLAHLRGSLAVGDINRDGRDDLVLTQGIAFVPGSIVILNGDRDNFFRQPTIYQVPNTPAQVAVADFVGEGQLSILVTFTDTNKIGWILNPSAASKIQMSDQGQLSPGGGPVVVADFDGDGLTDVAFEGTTGPYLLRALGNLQFERGALNYAPAGNVRSIAAVDVNHDRLPDLVIPTPEGVEVFLNLGRGQFASPRAIGALAVGDFNGDGRTDLLDFIGGSIDIGARAALADQQGGFGNGHSQYEPYNGPSSLAHVVDVDADGKLDFVYTETRFFSQPSNRVFVGRGDGRGGFQVLPFTRIGQQITSSAVADFNHDGHPDLVIGNQGTYAAAIAFGRGDGTFEAAIPLDFAVGRAIVLVGDFNGDGWPDLFVRREATSFEDVAIALNDRHGGFLPYTVVKFPERQFFVADLDGDGIDDVIAVTLDTLHLYFGRGDGTFEQTSTFALARSLDAVNVAVADLDGDGILDIAVGISEPFEGSHLIVLKGEGGRKFVQSALLRTVGAAIALGDFNGDGKVDLVDNGYPLLSVCEQLASPRHRSAHH